ncbi:MAG TPA: hypothetical protein VHG09_08330 [Longimicrobiales bacterium]|nr:hypothetical protein [Longimicrobiales bacterium]
MKFEEFEQRARQEWERIPAEYRAGVDGLRIERSALPHASLPDVYTLGECVTESYPSDFGGPETTRSVVVLYYGSFFRLSRQDPEFDWEVEVWETLTHELQHHLESLARDDSLGDMDYATDENYRRYQGEPFDPLFYRHGVPGAGGWRRVEDEFFIELEHSPAEAVEFEWHGRRYRVAVPATDTPVDIVFLTVTGGVPDAPGALHLVLIVRPPWLQGLLQLVRPRTPRVAQHDVNATAI